MKKLILWAALGYPALATGVFDVTGAGTLSFQGGQLTATMGGLGRTGAGDTLQWLIENQPIDLCGGTCFEATNVRGNFLERTLSGGVAGLIDAGRMSFFISTTDFNAGVLTALRDDGMPPPLDVVFMRAVGVEGPRTFNGANWTSQMTITPVPEPATALPAGLGVLALLLRWRRSASQSEPDGYQPGNRA